MSHMGKVVYAIIQQNFVQSGAQRGNSSALTLSLSLSLTYTHNLELDFNSREYPYRFFLYLETLSRYFLAIADFLYVLYL